MIHVFVEHTLNPEGKAYFADWVQEIHSWASPFEGFVDVKVIKDLQESNTVLLLEFEKYEHLQIWRTSNEHHSILSKIHPYHTGASKMRTYEW